MAFNPVFAAVGDDKRDIFGATEVGVFTITFGGADTYVAGGLALTKANFGLGRPLAGIQVIGYNTAAIGMEFFWDQQAQTLKARWTGAAVSGPLAEVTNGTAIANFVITVVAYTIR